MRILLFGDPEGISQLLKRLPQDCVVGVVGASIRPQYLSELKAICNRNSLPFYVQPKFKSDEYEMYRSMVKGFKPDLMLVNSYSMIIRNDILSMSRLGGLNIHTSLLPRNRGCNPTQWAIINNENYTGVTLHEIDEGLDTGPIVDQKKVPILFEDTWLDVRDRLREATDVLLNENLPGIICGNWHSNAQAHDAANYGRRRTPEDGVFQWSQPLVDIHNIVRALVTPLPPARYYSLTNEIVKVKTYQTLWQLTIAKYSPDIGGYSLLSELVSLRPLQRTDLPLVYKLFPDWIRSLQNAVSASSVNHNNEAWIENIIKNRSDLVGFAMTDLHNKNLFGILQLLNIDWFDRTVDVQITMSDQTYQKNGYIDEALKLIKGFCIKDLKLDKINNYEYVKNFASTENYEQTSFSRN